jgi:uncharacterized protein (DUF2249 family)
MIINGQTKVSEIIKFNMEAIDVIASINSHFKKLKNPILRALLAPRVNLAEASKIGKCELNYMLMKLEEIGFEIEKNVVVSNENLIVNENSIKSEMKNNFIPDFKEMKITKSIDVRPLIEKNEDPFLLLLKEVNLLNEDEVLEVINSFEPIPLIRILNNKGFLSYSFSKNDEFLNQEIHYTYFKNGAKSKSIHVVDSEFNIIELSFEEFKLLEKSFENKIKEINVRELEMPLPMVTILEELDEINKKYALKVLHKKIPQYLLPELEERNYKVFFTSISENEIILLIHK